MLGTNYWGWELLISVIDQQYPLNQDSLENEVAEVRLNVPWAQQAEEKTQLPGFQIKTFLFKYIDTQT